MDSDLLRVLDEAHARQLPALIAEWAQARDDRAWIARALRIDLALLTERPELVVPCVYRRCAFIGDDDGFYRDRVELGAMDSLRARVAAWGEHAARPWLRALRPPPVPLDGAVIEEYRTSERGELWASGEHVGVGGVAWERATGRRASVRAPVRRTPRAWTVARANTWGHCVIERGDERVDLAISSGEYIRGVTAVTDELVLFRGDDLDNDDFYGILDTRNARILWRTDGDCRSVAMLDDNRMLVGQAHGIDTVVVRTGDGLARWRCPYVGELVALPDGNIAMRTGDVIRVWNAGEALQRPQVVHPSTNSWTRAAFSPDGERLVTGTVLCDGRTGRFIAQLRCNGPRGWLEGGPPERCQRLCAGVFAEITPFGLTIWDTADGRELVRDRDRRANVTDCVAFDPQGQYHAIWQRNGALHIYRLRDGALVRELAQALPDWGQPRALGFSRDGSLLAWITATGERRVMRLEAPYRDGPLAPDEDPWEPPPAELRVTDGLLAFGDAAISCDDSSVVVSPDGNGVAGLTSHYVVQP